MTIINTVAGSSAKLAQKEVVPTSFPVSVEPPEGYDGLSKATVNAPENLSAENIKAGVDIAGVVGGYAPKLQEAYVVIDGFPQSVEPDEGYDGLKSAFILTPQYFEAENIKKGVEIAGVVGTYDNRLPEEEKTAKIETYPAIFIPSAGKTMSKVTVTAPDNLAPENIKNGVTIAGVTGTYGDGLRFNTECHVISPDVTPDMFPPEIDTITQDAFKYWMVSSIAIPPTIKTIKDYAFYYCGASTITLNDCVETIGTYAFAYCHSLSSLILPDSVTSIGRAAFTELSMVENLRFPPHVTTVTNGICWMCSELKSVVLPQDLITIENQAFGFCSKLTSVTIPEKTTTIGDGAFYYNSRLQSVNVLPSVPPSLGTDVFFSTSSSLVITVPKGTLEAYKTATNWSAYADIMVEASE